jgi:hypothetical protein
MSGTTGTSFKIVSRKGFDVVKGFANMQIVYKNAGNVHVAIDIALLERCRSVVRMYTLLPVYICLLVPRNRTYE